MASGSIFRKLIAGSDARMTRFHDEKGNRVSWGRLFLNFPRALLTGLARVLFGYRVALPWISYSAISAISKRLTQSSRVLEFGSGMSTIWYAKRVGEVFSVENNAVWFTLVCQTLSDRPNVHVALREDTNSYFRYCHEDEAGFDLIVVDGIARNECVREGLRKLRPNGALYLDNSDRMSAEIRDAEALCVEYARATGAKITFFTDFAPTQFFVQQGLMLVRE